MKPLRMNSGSKSQDSKNGLFSGGGHRSAIRSLVERNNRLAEEVIEETGDQHL